jgi:hypothetical protein
VGARPVSGVDGWTGGQPGSRPLAPVPFGVADERPEPVVCQQRCITVVSPKCIRIRLMLHRLVRHGLGVAARLALPL